MWPDSPLPSAPSWAKTANWPSSDWKTPKVRQKQSSQVNYWNDYNGGELRINANSVMTLPQAREKFARNLTLTCCPEHDIEALLNLLAQYRSSGREGIPLRVRYRNDTAEGELDLQRRWQINADAALFEQLQNLLGEYGVNVGW